MHDDYDRSGKWLIQHHGDAILRLGGVQGIQSWRSLQAQERANLLAVTQVLTRLRYNDPRMLMLLGGQQIMIESPLLQEMWAAKMHKLITQLLVDRFGTVPADLIASWQSIEDEAKLEELLRAGYLCPDLEAFGNRLASLR